LVIWRGIIVKPGYDNINLRDENAGANYKTPKQKNIKKCLYFPENIIKKERKKSEKQ
jgi:hypothetical protein